MTKKNLLLSFVVVAALLFARAAGAAAAYDSSAISQNGGSGSIPSFNVNVVTPNNVACFVGVAKAQAGDSVTSITVGGQTASLISGTSFMYGAKLGNVSGNQAVVVTLSASFGVAAGVVCANGVDQTTPFNHGNESDSGFSSGTASITVTSTSGDLTVDWLYDGAGNGVTLNAGTTTQRILSNQNSVCSSTNKCVAASTGDGSGTNTHAWTTPGGDGYQHGGANFVAAAATGRKSPSLLLLSVGCEY